MKFQQNLKKNFATQDAWMNHAGALATGLAYPIIPKLLGLDGYAGMLVGAGVPALIGGAFDIPGVLHASVGIMASHLSYVYVAPNVFEDEVAWSLVPEAEVSGLAESSVVTLPNGEQVTVYDLPGGTEVLNDYYQENMGEYYNEGMSEYYTENISDYYSEDQETATAMNDDFQANRF